MHTQELSTMPPWASDVFNTLPPLCTFRDIGEVAKMHKNSVSNLLAEGKAPQGSFLMGKKRLFPRLEVVQWLVERAESSKA